LYGSGGPKQLTQEQLRTSLNSAINALQEENMRSRGGPLAGGGFTQDPGNLLTQGHTGFAGDMQLWKLLPAVQHLPAEMLCKLSEETLFQLNNALARENKMAGKMQTSARLTLNAQQLVAAPVPVAAGLDDRRDILHFARFLGGASCSAQAVWIKAREALGAKGVLAIGNYDLDSVGCGGCVTPKGWLEIHNPGSTELKLKLFHMPNVGGSALAAKKVSIADNSSSISVKDDMAEVADLESFRSALNALREAMAAALPWNRSVSAIIGFMVNSAYCGSDLQANPRRGAILTEFVDYILGRNALNWENGQPFLSTDDLSHVWATWKGKRASSFQIQEKKQDKSRGALPFQRVKDDICRRFNSPTGCPNKADACKTFYGTKLRHVCNVYLSGGRGKKCEKDHCRTNHK